MDQKECFENKKAPLAAVLGAFQKKGQLNSIYFRFFRNLADNAKGWVLNDC